MFADEVVESNTSQTEDGNVATGKLFLFGKGERLQQRSAQKDANFTVIGLQLQSNGNPIICAISFAVKTLDNE